MIYFIKYNKNLGQKHILRLQLSAWTLFLCKRIRQNPKFFLGTEACVNNTMFKLFLNAMWNLSTDLFGPFIFESASIIKVKLPNSSPIKYTKNQFGPLFKSIFELFSVYLISVHKYRLSRVNWNNCAVDFCCVLTHVFQYG
jgi:hypothetical protein